MSHAARAYRTVLSAVAGIDARVLLTVGRRFDASQLGELPRNVRVERWVDQEVVLGGAELVVCHGGSGTTYGALAAGVPVVIWPMFADQFANGRTVAATGAGLTLRTEPDGHGGAERVDHVDVQDLVAAIGTVRADPSYRQRALSIAGEMSAAPSATAVLRAVAARR
jgi:UDP:flavonoid glycosyltransferase YjiC (YdhE family)